MTAVHESDLAHLEHDPHDGLVWTWPRIETTNPREDYL